MYGGRDTAYYLHRGYKVVAIDANPRLIEEARRRFPDEVESGRLTLLNIGIAFERKRSRLYYNEDDLGAASLNASHVERIHTITDFFDVQCIPFGGVLREYGVPYYLKVDIETLDRACLVTIDAANAPAHVSWENGDDALENLSHLRSVGYKYFKLINQVTFRELSREESLWNRARYRWNRTLGRPELPCRTSDGWEFRAGCAGPFGPETDGSWRTHEGILTQWNAFCRRHPDFARRGWYDFHAHRQGIR